MGFYLFLLLLWDDFGPRLCSKSVVIFKVKYVSGAYLNAQCSCSILQMYSRSMFWLHKGPGAYKNMILEQCYFRLFMICSWSSLIICTLYMQLCIHAGQESAMMDCLCCQNSIWEITENGHLWQISSGKEERCWTEAALKRPSGTPFEDSWHRCRDKGEKGQNQHLWRKSNLYMYGGRRPF